MITACVIPHKKQRYPTAGDWKYSGNALYVLVSQLGDPRYEALVTVHEIIEAILCKHAGITQEAVDAFDMSHVDQAEAGEPGDHPDAPYRRQHGIATAIERLLAAEMGVDWVEYEKAIDAL